METKQERLDQINAQIDILYEEKRDLERQIADEVTAVHRRRVDSWGLKAGSSLVLFTKSPIGYHYHIAKTLKIIDIDFKHQSFEAIESSYSEADYEYFVKAQKTRFSFSELENIENEFNVYIVEESQVALLNEYFWDLALTYSNYKEYEKLISKKALMSINIPV